MDINDIISGITSSGALNSAASQAGIDPAQATSMLSGVLDHVSNGGSTDDIATVVADKTGLDAGTVNQFLPVAMSLLQGHADATGDQGGLGGILGALGGAGGGAGGLLGMAAGLFGNKS